MIIGIILLIVIAVFLIVLVIEGCKAVRFLLDSKNCLLLSGYDGMADIAGSKSVGRSTV